MNNTANEEDCAFEKLYIKRILYDRDHIKRALY